MTPKQSQFTRPARGPMALGRDGRTTRESGCLGSNPTPRAGPRARGLSFSRSRPALRRKAGAPRKGPTLEPTEMEPTYDERPLADIKRRFEQLVARGELEVVPATADDLRRARIPAHAGSVFVSTARAYRSVRLNVADVVFHLHEGGEVETEPGGWRLRAEPEEIDLRIATRGVSEDDWVVDATWTPHGDEPAVHSTILHFLVRAAVGDSA